MDLRFNTGCAAVYTNLSQKVRVMSESWLRANQFCPACGNFPMNSYGNNQPVADFFCGACNEQYELKSQARKIGRIVADGAYRTMVDRIISDTNPNFLFLSYSKEFTVIDLQLVPKHFLSVQAIKQRKPLAETARRAGWQGCNILMNEIASSGRIALVKDGEGCPKAHILRAWRNTMFIRSQGGLEGRSWLLNVMRCIDRLDKPCFTLGDVYGFESDLNARYPANRNIRPKIRQQLQMLRDNGYIKFLGNGIYSRVGAA